LTEENLGDAALQITEAASNPVVDAQARASSLRSKIMGINDASTELVVIPEWDNVEIEFHSLTGAEKSDWLARLDLGSEKAKTQEDKARRLQLFVELAIHTAYLPGTDTKLFEPNDSSWLLTKSAKSLARLEDTVGKLNGFVNDDSTEGKDTEVDKAKNS
jgi:hypothetical protein